MKRKRYSNEFKKQLIQEAKEVGSIPEVARRHEINPKALYRWIQESKHKNWQNFRRANQNKTVSVHLNALIAVRRLLQKRNNVLPQ